MRNAPEVVREIGVDDVRVATEHQLLRLNDCLLGVSPSAVGVDFRRKIGFEDPGPTIDPICRAIGLTLPPVFQEMPPA